MFDEVNTRFRFTSDAGVLTPWSIPTALDRDSLKAKESHLPSQHGRLSVLEFLEAAFLLDFTL